MNRFPVLFLLSFEIMACETVSNFPPVEEPNEDQLLHLDMGNSDVLDEAFFVTEEELSSYISFKMLKDNRDHTPRQIIPVVDENEDVLLYIINYEDGWDIVAADKRATLPLGSSSTGSLVIGETNSPIFAWIACLAEDVLILRKASVLEYANADIVSYNLTLWRMINAEESLFSEILEDIFPKEHTRALVPPNTPYPGHFELVSISSVSYVYDSISHLIPLAWSQTVNNCNDYVPFKSNSTTERAPAGCVAIAGAQMLYYLNSKIGYPETAPMSAYCIGDIHNYSFGQSDYSSAAWSQMSYYGGTTAAKLIASVACLVHMSFGDDGSGAYTSDLTDDCFPFYSVSSDYANYNEFVVKESLLNEMPVIISADGTSSWFNFQDGHAFIIDGYIRYQTETTGEYEWVWDNYNPSINYPKVPNQTLVTYSSPYMSRFKMNWGWGGLHNDASFAASGDWNVIIDGDEYNFIYRRHMIHNFSGPQD